MARTGRPVIGRTRKSLNRDIAALRRLQKSLRTDERLDAEAACSAAVLIDRLVEYLLRLDISAA